MSDSVVRAQDINSKNKISRRKFLRSLGVVSSASMAAFCLPVSVASTETVTDISPKEEVNNGYFPWIGP